MKLWIVVWEDRHSDTSAHPFSTLDKAQAFISLKVEWYRAIWRERGQELSIVLTSSYARLEDSFSMRVEERSLDVLE